MINIKENVLERFLRYTKIHTTSDYNSKTFPSTERQIDFGRTLVLECEKIGLENVSIDKNGYVVATLKANIDSNDSDNIPTIGFIAHMDTSPDCSGENVNPVLNENYKGDDIELNGITLSPKEFPELLNYKGDTIITSDGNTLLGADDKAGIAEILTAMEYLIANPDIKHGDIKIGFTPDEEIGRGVDYFDVESFGADFAYTLDGGEIGELQHENFYASRSIITIRGKSVHPGHAKNIMVNSALVGLELASLLPADETPATTENYEGFFHLCDFKGNVEETKLNYIIRDFDFENFQKRKDIMTDIVAKINDKFPDCVDIEITDEYANMHEIIEKTPHIVELAKQAMECVNVEPKICPIRGGTDGARLSYMNLPCPNIFAGGYNFHGKYEFVPLSSMVKAVEVVVKIAEITAKTRGC